MAHLTLRPWLLGAFFLLAGPPLSGKDAPETAIQYLSGTDKDHTVPWDFMVSQGMQAGVWSSLPVPSNWEMQGFGAYGYGFWTGKPDEQGRYRLRFQAPPAWNGQAIRLVFEGAMTDTEVALNGQSAGPVHQGGFTPFAFDVSRLLHYGGENLLEVLVRKASSEPSINNAEKKADYWNFGGIYRPVYLEIAPPSSMQRVAIDARADGTFRAELHLKGAKKGDLLTARLRRWKGSTPVQAFSTEVDDPALAILSSKLKAPALWSAEFPDLYEAEFDLARGGKTLHRIRQRFGFRSIEVRPGDGVYLNGTRIMLKGVNRHSHWPESGRTLSDGIHRLDIGLIKGMNMNAVRMSHYPPDRRFLDLCDELGLYVLDESPGWQAAYATAPGRRIIQEMVERDANHPSILFWDNGNEGGWNRELDGDFAVHDPQQRVVLHPWEQFAGFDSKHYINYQYLADSALYGRDILMPTEFMHGLYDGGSGAGLDDFWELMQRHPRCAGGFLWAFHDEGSARTDQGGKLDTQGNAAPDGIVGPHREKEGSYGAIREIWSPIQVRPPNLGPAFNGLLEVENRYDFRDLNRIRFEWKLLSFPGPRDAGPDLGRSSTPQPFALAPHCKGLMKLELPGDWSRSDALRLVARDETGAEVMQWTWAIKAPAAINASRLSQAGSASVGAALELRELAGSIEIRDGELTYRFDRSSGFLAGVARGGIEIPLSNGPDRADGHAVLAELAWRREGSAIVYEPIYTEASALKVKWTFLPGAAARLDTSYAFSGAQDFAGIRFDFPEELVTGMRWLGRGPYRVWKNRLKGPSFGVWEKPYNDAVTGETWEVPEFKGYHADMNWVLVRNSRSDFIVWNQGDPVFLQMLKPRAPSSDPQGYCTPPFPRGDLGFLSAISAIGTKFQPASDLGPQGAKNVMRNYGWIQGSLSFDFR